MAAPDRPASPFVADGAMALEATAVAKRYQMFRAWALHDVSLSIPHGTLTALVGPNGAGKSTLIRCWLGVERPTSGRVRVMGVDPQRHGKRAIRMVGYLSQSSALYRGLSVSDHLDLAKTLRSGFDRTVAIQQLDKLSIPLSQRAGELSGGQQAHVSLAIALGTRAPVLLLDEPLASLDPLARHEFLQVLVDEVRARGATALLSSHIVSDVESACDAIVVLGAGRVMLHASIDAALAGHRLAPAMSGSPERAIAIFRRDGEHFVLARSTDPRLATPTLEELVMGYLAAARPQVAPTVRADRAA